MIATAKDRYHHGNLRRALMDEALLQTRERGIDSWSMREIAAEVGVSHTAPYHHFKDRDGFVRALAFEGIERMDERMAEAQAAAGDDACEGLLAVGMAYVEFAVERPDYYAAMSAVALLAPCDPAAEIEHGPTWTRLVDAVVRAQGAGILPAGDPVIIAVSLWSLVHGLVELWRSGALRPLPQAAAGLTPMAENVLRAAVSAMEVVAKEEGA